MKWYAKITGYVEISLLGEHPERVINMAMSRGLYLWDIKQLDEGLFTIKVEIGRASCRERV